MDNDQIYKDFEKAYNELSEPIFRHCYFRLYNRERAMEVSQDVFLKTWDYLREGNEVQNLRAFIYKVAHNLIINEVTRRKLAFSLDELHDTTGFDPAGDNEEEVAQNKFDGQLMLSKIKDLHPSYRDVLYMRYADGLTVKEIANSLNEKENNISVRIHRGLERLRVLYNKKPEKRK